MIDVIAELQKDMFTTDCKLRRHLESIRHQQEIIGGVWSDGTRIALECEAAVTCLRLRDLQTLSDRLESLIEAASKATEKEQSDEN